MSPTSQRGQGEVPEEYKAWCVQVMARPGTYHAPDAPGNKGYAVGQSTWCPSQGVLVLRESPSASPSFPPVSPHSKSQTYIQRACSTGPGWTLLYKPSGLFQQRSIHVMSQQINRPPSRGTLPPAPGALGPILTGLCSAPLSRGGKLLPRPGLPTWACKYRFLGR